MGKQKSVKKRKLPDIKSLIFGSSNKEITIPGSQFPNGTQGLVPVVDISLEEIENYTAYGEFVTCKNLTKGNWQVTFPLENME